MVCLPRPGPDRTRCCRASGARFRVAPESFDGATFGRAPQARAAPGTELRGGVPTVFSGGCPWPTQIIGA